MEWTHFFVSHTLLGKLWNTEQHCFEKNNINTGCCVLGDGTHIKPVRGKKKGTTTLFI